MIFFFFFFKQKTAYEMRISDWSSDVCTARRNSAGTHPEARAALSRSGRFPAVPRNLHREGPRRWRCYARQRPGDHFPCDGRATHKQPVYLRSEEHTSELQSLMRISYPVFRLKNQSSLHCTELHT